MSPRVILSVFVRALPVVGPLLRTLDRLTLYALTHEARIDLLEAKARAAEVPPLQRASVPNGSVTL